ncbi:MAG: carbon-nitrogen hydrolase family protein [Alphaproteobacteria bacterium]|nr:carbon-nitrogen hydrolase family protein [Alphaproteobacteria bacterium]
MVEARLRLAAAQYPIGRFGDFAAYRDKLRRWVARAAAAKARILLFPEYGAMELASLFGAEVAGDLRAQLVALQDLLDKFRELHADLARRHRLYIVAASYPVAAAGGFRNRVHVFAPDGRMGHQDKRWMTRFEDERWAMAAGEELTLFEAEFGGFAVQPCYDIEFPVATRALAQAGARLVLVPSCTDALAGYWRVRIGAQARALENQCAVAMAPTVGLAPWSAAVDVNVGAAGVFLPPDRGLPDTGVLAVGPLNRPRWLFADIDLAALDRVPADGQVLNARDSRMEATRPLSPVRRLCL